jgi:hypothetical protein
MYEVDINKNKLSKIELSSFSHLNLKERSNLQEWIVNNPEVFGEDILIIHKEFDGFDGTNERLDILALDKNGYIVVIENKGDSSGRDVVWQNLKYVSYCSTLTKNEIIDIYQNFLDKYRNGEKALENLQDFFDVEDMDEIIINEDQRLFFVALNYRKEVTSTVIWLLNKGIDIKCFKISMYNIDNKLLMDIEQIIPVKETQDYIISMNKKTSDMSIDKKKVSEIHNLRREYWSILLEKLHNCETELFKNISPSKDHWLSCSSGTPGIIYNLLSCVDFAGVELYIAKASQKQNKEVFDKLYAKKEEIENIFGNKLDWRRLNDKKSSRIVYLMEGVSIKNKETWEEMQEFHLEYLIKLEKSFKAYLIKIK